MPGSRITKKQEEIYMRSRQTGLSQEVAAAKRGVSVRSGRRIERGERSPVLRTWRTREDPLAAVWEVHLAPLLARAPDLTGLTLLEYLEDTFPGGYCGPCSVGFSTGRRCSRVSCRYCCWRRS